VPGRGGTKISTTDTTSLNAMGPDDVTRQEFSTVLRGYDRDEVRSFLDRVALAWHRSLLRSATRPTDDAEGVAAPESEEGSPAPATTEADAGAVAEDDAEPTDEEPTAEDEPAPSVATPTPGAVVTPGAVTGEGAEAAERDRATAYAQRLAAELDRASARTELAQAQQQALQVIDTAQRRADVVLQGARARARSEAEATLADARSRLAPLLEQERAVQARLAKLRDDLEALTRAVADAPDAPLPTAEEVVDEVEEDPSTPQPPFPHGFGSVTVE